MIVMPVHALWTLLGIWLAVTVCAFMFGWYARAYSHAERAEFKAPRRHPSALLQPERLPQPGQFPVLQDNYPDEPAVGRWWPALERIAPPVTTPFSHVQVSNWEKRIQRDTDAWLHERGML